MKLEPCEFNSLELISMAMQHIRQAIDNPDECNEYLSYSLSQLAQAYDQLVYNDGQAVPFPTTQQNYDALSLEEKVKRLEVCAKLYLGWHGTEDPARAMRDDCTRYWEEMQKAGGT